MTFSMQRMYAIFVKDLKELSKNTFVLTTIIMPVVLALFFGRGDAVPLEVHFLVFNTAFAAVAAYIQSVAIAEEKEKNTLRGLMMSPATTVEILTGKSIVSMGMTVLTIVLCIRLLGFETANWLLVGAGMAVSLVLFTAIGTLIGLLTRTLMEASVVITPFIFILGMGTIFAEMLQGNVILTVAEYLPNFQLEYLAAAVESGAATGEIAGHFALLLGWTAAVIAATALVYRKREMGSE
ncbi:ABC transporter permease [Alteribacter natronophilus]|uniref:ABC transporter permease n=1 Tax=Alteribacter natronophilus TaxID=2583810 RepID=UPI00110E4F01|nr:ABC transporter permease [Alteribacter natronophilus]TMW70866.1 ABC transporter permease [Alteribacter natronophilus]